MVRTVILAVTSAAIITAAGTYLTAQAALPTAQNTTAKSKAAPQTQQQKTAAPQTDAKSDAKTDAKPLDGKALWQTLPDARSFQNEPFLRAAIALQAQGKEKAIPVLQQLVAADGTGASMKGVILCRMLFVAKPGQEFRAPGIGTPAFFGGSSAEDWPLEPIEIVNGIPYVVIKGINGARNSPQTAVTYLQYCIDSCEWNPFQYELKADHQKEFALNALQRSPKFKKPLAREEITRLQRQNAKSLNLK